MATSVLQVRVEEELKNEAAALFEKLGIDTPTAVRMFLKRAVSERGIPFELRESSPRYGAGRG
ncbi:MAG: type II toxin-antitoxin system RelB/DinJ family antitoxin, partial [Fibrobacterales bacterium]|nr:type II toxin-antitoxin system RelB/DinJ family antitoxin [Fibrobacterales bacterium]